MGKPNKASVFSHLHSFVAESQQMHQAGSVLLEAEGPKTPGICFNRVNFLKKEVGSGF
jgi:hypothetical protein